MRQTPRHKTLVLRYTLFLMSMRDFKRLATYCKELGQEVIGRTKDGHFIYDYPDCPHLCFTDSSPHEIRIS